MVLTIHHQLAGRQLGHSLNIVHFSYAMRIPYVDSTNQKSAFNQWTRK